MYEDLQQAPLWIIAFLIQGGFHEAAHAWTAYKLGDPTAEMQGRMTVNPIPHIDPMGLIFLILMAIGGMGIAWMKPVPVNIYNLRNPRRDLMLIALAGPVCNILLALPFALLLRFVPGLYVESNPISQLLLIFLDINVLLAAFNLLPIYPLDGSKVVLGLIPEHLAETWEKTFNYGIWVLLFLLVTRTLKYALFPIVTFIYFIIGLG